MKKSSKTANRGEDGIDIISDPEESVAIDPANCAKKQRREGEDQVKI